jgi:hypothetical protein
MVPGCPAPDRDRSLRVASQPSTPPPQTPRPPMPWRPASPKGRRRGAASPTPAPRPVRPALASRSPRRPGGDGPSRPGQARPPRDRSVASHPGTSPIPSSPFRRHRPRPHDLAPRRRRQSRPAACPARTPRNPATARRASPPSIPARSKDHSPGATWATAMKASRQRGGVPTLMRSGCSRRCATPVTTRPLPRPPTTGTDRAPLIAGAGRPPERSVRPCAPTRISARTPVRTGRRWPSSLRP